MATNNLGLLGGVVQDEDELSKLFAPIAPPIPLKDRMEKLSTSEENSEVTGLLSAMLKGQMLRDEPDPKKEFENFFRTRYSPAQSFLVDAIRGQLSLTQGRKYETTRDESLKEFALFEQQKQNQIQSRQQLIQVVSSTLDRNRALDQAKNLAETKAMAEARQKEFDNNQKILDFQIKYLTLENSLNNGTSTRATAELQREKLQKEIKEAGMASPNSPFGVATRVWQQEHEGKTPGSAAELEEFKQVAAGFTEAFKTKPQNISLITGDQNLEAMGTMFRNGTMTFPQIQKAVGPMANAVLANLSDEHAIIKDKKFLEGAKAAIISLNSASEITDLIKEAKRLGGVAPDDPGFIQKVKGYLLNTQGTLGGNAIAEVLKGLVPLEVRQKLQAAGEGAKMSDQDVKLMADAVNKITDTEQTINLRNKLTSRIVLGTVIQDAKRLVQISPPDTNSAPKKFNNFPIEKIMPLAQETGKDPEEIIITILEAGGSFK